MDTIMVLKIATNELPTGFTVRGATLEDVDLVVNLFNDHSRHFLGVEKYRSQAVRTEWVLPDFNPAEDIRLVFAPDGALVGYCEFWDLIAPYVRKNLWYRVHPAYQDAGIDYYLLAWAEGRAAEAFGRAPQSARVVLQGSANNLDRLSQAAFLSANYRHIRTYLRMVIELDQALPAPQWPASIQVRTLQRGQDERRAIEAVYESFKDHWGFVQEPFESYLERWLHFLEHNEEFDPSLWFLAMDGEQVAGVSLCYPKVDEDPGMAWVGTLGVRRPWRRHRLGLALLQHSFAEFFRRGKLRAGLGVDASSLTGATRLYEKAGMCSDPQREFILFEKELRPGEDLTTQQVE